MDPDALVQDIAAAHSREDREVEESLLEQLVRVDPRAANKVVRAGLHMKAAGEAWSQNQPRLGLKHLHVALDLYNAADVSKWVDVGLAHCQSGLAHFHLQLEEHSIARSHFRTALHLYQSLQMEDESDHCESMLIDLDEYLLQQAHEQYDLGVALRTSDRTASRAHLTCARDIFEDLGARRELADRDFDLATQEDQGAANADARELYSRARQIYADLKLQQLTAECDWRLAEIELDLRHAESARFLAHRALAVFRDLGSTGDAAHCEVLMGYTYLPANPDLAIAHFERARDDFMILGCRAALTETYEALAFAEFYRSGVDAARTSYALSRYGYEEGEEELPADLHVGLGQIAFAAGNDDDADRHFRTACDRFGQLQDIPSLCAVEILLAKLLYWRGDITAALDMAVPAALVLDSYRFQLSAADDRAGWRIQIERLYEEVLDLAIGSGDGRLVAELIESARASGVPSDSDIPSGSPAWIDMSSLPDDLNLWPRQFGAEAVTSVSISPPPAVVMPWGVALRWAMQIAEERVRPIRARHQVVLVL